ncbi:non-ribosomal peptide synthetase [Paracidovorax citrulli]
MTALTPDFARHAQMLGREQLAMVRQGGTSALPPVTLTATIDGVLDTERLHQALLAVAARHPASGLVFGQVDGLLGLRQQFADVPPLLADGALPGHGTPALHATLHALGPERHRLTLSAHPLALDGASLMTLTAELAQACADALPGDGSPLSYADYLDWSAALAQENRDSGSEYWLQVQQRIAALNAPRLPWRKGSNAGTAALATQSVPLDAGEATALRDWAGTLEQPLPLVLQAAWWLLLARLDPAGAFCGGWHHDCRADFEALVGSVGRYEAALPLAIDPDPRAPFAAWLAQLAGQCEQHLDWREHCPPDAAAGQPGRVGFAMTGDVAAVEQGGLRWQVHAVDSLVPGFELALEVRSSEADGAVQLTLRYDAELYRADAMACLLDQYATLLRTLRMQADTPIEALPLATAADAARAEAMHVPALNAGAQLLPDRVAQWGRDRPLQPALSAPGLQWNYEELNRRVDRLASGLFALGVKNGDPVGLLLPRSAELVVALLAVMRAGGAYLPLDPAWPAARRASILSAAGAALVLTDAAHLPVVQGPARHVDVAALEGASTVSPARAEAGASSALSPLDASQPAYILYTSGSTGTPKGVAVSHGALLNYAAASGDALELDTCQRFALTSTVAADLGNTTLFGAFWHGACLCVADENDMGDAASFAAFLARERVQCLKIVPSHLDALIDGDGGALPLAAGAVIVLGGEAASPALLSRLRERAPQARVCNHYGPTEATVGILVHDAGIAQALTGDPLPLTRVLANCEAQVRTAAGHLAATGETGELVLGGAQLCDGYLGRTALAHTPDTPDDPFLPHPTRAGQRLYRSGDRARYLPQGGIELLGRADGQLKVRGFRIECGEIEHALAKLPGVRQALVMPAVLPGEPTCLAAWLVPDDPANVPLSAAHRKALRQALAERLPEPMIPAQWFAVASLPRLPNGKVDRAALMQSSSEHPDDAVPGREPATAMEALLLDQMRELLEAPQLGVQDDLFEAGGHSLLVIKLVARIRKLLKVEIAPAVVFDAPSAAALACALGARADNPAALETLAALQRQLATMSPEARAALRASAGAAAGSHA